MTYYVPGKSSLYEQDFMRWAEAQAEGLHRAAEAGSNLPLDWHNLAEEIESLGRSQRRELRSLLAIIVEHLLKLQFSPMIDPRAGWIETIGRERRDSRTCSPTVPAFAMSWSRWSPSPCNEPHRSLPTT